jgi:hypothetical protein
MNNDHFLIGSIFFYFLISFLDDKLFKFEKAVLVFDLLVLD